MHMCLSTPLGSRSSSDKGTSWWQCSFHQNRNGGRNRKREPCNLRKSLIQNLLKCLFSLQSMENKIAKSQGETEE